MSKAHSNLTVKVPATVGNVFTISAGGSGGSGGILSNGSYSWTQPYNLNSQTTGVTQVQSSLKVSGDAEFAGAVKIQGMDIGAALAKINQRLAILTPDPKLLDKYTALREAYDHYQTLEALCVESDADRTEK
jgi:hypothetical protein